MKLAPDRKKFMEVIGGSGDLNADMEEFCKTFSLLLEENHKYLVRNQLSVFMVPVKFHHLRKFLFSLSVG